MNIAKRIMQIIVLVSTLALLILTGIKDDVNTPKCEDPIEALVEYLGADYEDVYYEIAYEEVINGEVFDCINGYVDTGEDIHRLFTYAVSKDGRVIYQRDEDPLSDNEWIHKYSFISE